MTEGCAALVPPPFFVFSLLVDPGRCQALRGGKRGDAASPAIN